MSVSFAATNFIVYQEIPQKLFEFLQGFIHNKIMFLIALNLFLLVVGCFMDIFSALVVVVPLIYPIAYEYNINLVHLGIIFLANLEIGYLTPPVGMNLFVAALRFKKSIIYLYKVSINFILISLFTLLVITYVPTMSLWFMEKPAIQGVWELLDEDTGVVDRLILKSGGSYLRKSIDPNDLFSAFNSYSTGTFAFNGKNLVFDEGAEAFPCEIYNDGKRLLLIDNNVRQFYINQIIPPLNEAQGQLVGSWEDSAGTTFTFFFNGKALVEEDGIVREYIYRTKKKKLLFNDLDLVEQGDFSPVQEFHIISSEGKLKLKELKSNTIYELIYKENLQDY